jgi:hypothetical protein
MMRTPRYSNRTAQDSRYGLKITRTLTMMQHLFSKKPQQPVSVLFLQQQPGEFRQKLVNSRISL